MIFGFFDAIQYDGKPTADIYHSYKSYFDAAAQKYILRNYMIVGSPRPELLSYQLYGNTEYYWVLLMLNNIYDPFHGWVKDESAVHASTEQKYQNFLPNKQNTILYHKDSLGNIYYRLTEYPTDSRNWYDIGDTMHLYPQHVGTLVPVTAIEHELNANEDKRIIKIISPGDISAFLDDLSRIMERIKNGS